jgi:hypothetical protein
MSWAGQVVVVGRARKPKPSGSTSSTPSEDQAAFLGARFQDLEDELLFPHAGHAWNVERIGNLGQLAHAQSP